MLVSNKDSLIELQKEQIEVLKAKVEELKDQTPDALAESLSTRVEFQLAEIERLRNENNGASANTSNDVIVDAVISEIKDWKEEVSRNRKYRWSGSAHKRRIVSGYLGSKSERRQLFVKFTERGGTQAEWTRVLGTSVDDELYDKSVGWSITQWREYVFSQIEDPKP